MEDLKVSLVQSDIKWQDPQANRVKYGSYIHKLKGETDLIVLPEMFTTGFTMKAAEWAEDMDGETMHWMAQMADRCSAAVMGSLITKENASYFNRLVFMLPGGMYHTYDKRHLFAMAGEDQHYTKGEDRLVIQYKGWRICPMICYDLRFPVWSRNDNSYDLLVYVANWPDRRAHDWRLLLQARAIENQAYVVGVNRVGTDAEGHNYNGDSCVVDPGWRKVLYHNAGDAVVHTEQLSYKHLVDVREKLPFLTDRDEYKIL